MESESELELQIVFRCHLGSLSSFVVRDAYFYAEVHFHSSSPHTEMIVSTSLAGRKQTLQLPSEKPLFCQPLGAGCSNWR